MLAQLVDKIVMVIRAGTTPRECLSEAIKSLGSDRVKGVILNGADFGPTSKYYYYYGRRQYVIKLIQSRSKRFKCSSRLEHREIAAFQYVIVNCCPLRSTFQSFRALRI